MSAQHKAETGLSTKTLRLPKQGRPRSSAIHGRVLAVARSIGARCDYGEITMEMVAREANIAKSTLYRWWKSKAELMLEATSHRALVAPKLGSLREDISELLEQYSDLHLQQSSSRIELGLWADLKRSDQENGASSQLSSYLRQERAVIKEVLKSAKDQGELDEIPNSDLVLALLKGVPRHLRLVLGVRKNRISNRTLVDMILAALGH